jgi:hypothetical protein
MVAVEEGGVGPVEQLFHAAWDRIASALDRLSNASLTEWLLLLICLLLLDIVGALRNAAKQRYSIAKMMSRGERIE